MKPVTALLLTLGITGCMTDSSQLAYRSYAKDYHQALYDLTMGAFAQAYPKFSEMPRPLKAAYAECAADYVVSGLTPDQLQILDAYARNERHLTYGESKAIDADLRQKLGPDLTSGDLDRLASFCPDDVAGFKKYLSR